MNTNPDDIRDYYRKMLKQKEEWKNDLDFKSCRVCGKNSVNPNKLPSGSNREICQECFYDILEEIVKEKIIERVKSGKMYCETCLFHYKACKCKTKKGLDELRK